MGREGCNVTCWLGGSIFNFQDILLWHICSASAQFRKMYQIIDTFQKQVFRRKKVLKGNQGGRLSSSACTNNVLFLCYYRHVIAFKLPKMVTSLQHGRVFFVPHKLSNGLSIGHCCRGKDIVADVFLQLLWRAACLWCLAVFLKIVFGMNFHVIHSRSVGYIIVL